MKLYAALLLAFLSLTSLHASDVLNRFINHPSLRTATISLLIKDMQTGKVVAEHRSGQAAIPASTMKVVTTATALEMLGPEYRYETLVSYDGQLRADGTLDGNLYITGSGDPTLGSSKMGDNQFLSKWASAIQEAGIKRINGNIIGDDSCFDNEGSNPKWTWDDIGNYYAPGIWGIAYKDNTVAVTFHSGAIGTTPAIIATNPQVPGMTINNQLQSTKVNSDKAFFYGSPKSMERAVRGEIPANRPAFVVRAELPNPALLLAQDLEAVLINRGIETTGLAMDIDMYQNGRLLAPLNRTTIYSHLSVPLREIIKEANQKSNNFYTEQIFKTLSRDKNRAATNKRSIAIVQQYWRSKGLDTSELFMEDGSGLSPANAVSARFLTELMQYMYQKSSYKDEFFNSLAVAGKVGTLAGLMKNSHLDGKMIGKSGTISRVRSYTGYLTNQNREWVFAVIVNNPATNSWQTLRIIEDFLKEVSK
ncbi:MAG: D-alanyl-D-alanine carboxypeptidase/D-alanyl-D-alanine-endopeptidase [Paludibacter sp.]|nr:D-alanyl-D-alanine carboxypeptidase/D-alanyl-D-alanine-endopeptidase [Paludibacter sp.]